jgi:hypothetical protein
MNDAVNHSPTSSQDYVRRRTETVYETRFIACIKGSFFGVSRKTYALRRYLYLQHRHFLPLPTR